MYTSAENKNEKIIPFVSIVIPSISSLSLSIKSKGDLSHNIAMNHTRKKVYISKIKNMWISWKIKEKINQN